MKSLSASTLFRLIMASARAACLLFIGTSFLSAQPTAPDTFGNGTIKLPTSVSGGTGSVAQLQADDDDRYALAKSATMTVGNFQGYVGTIDSVYLFVQYTAEPGYSGNNTILVNGVDTGIAPADREYGRIHHINITEGSFGINTSAEIESMSVTFTNNDGGGSDNVYFDYVYVVVNPQTALPIHPDWSEDFNGTGQANPDFWEYEQGYRRNNELQYYMTGDSNGWMENGNFVIEAREEPSPSDPQKGVMDYTSASIRTENHYYWHYGRAQIRAKIPAVYGMWPAIWGVGEVGSWPHNGEVDIMEYYKETIKANCAVGRTTQWSSRWFSSTHNMSVLETVDPNWRDEYHIWTMQWDTDYVRIYMDNRLMKTVSQADLKNDDGYNTSWGPQYPFTQPFTCWLNLAMGGSAGGSVAGVTFPQRYLIDYWKIWEGATDNVAPTDITIDSSTVIDLSPAGTVVGYLTATDADPGEVLRYTLVSGTGDTHNNQFTIPEFISDNTLHGVLKTAQTIDYTNGATRSIRVRVTDIEGATYDKVLTLNVAPADSIEVSTSSLSVAEGGTQTFDVKLRTLPASNITVNISRSAGDSDISVSNGATLTFTPSNGTDWQTVTLAAAEDVDVTNGSATILCSDASATYSSTTVTAGEIDNDNVPPTVDAGTDQTDTISDGGSWAPSQISPVVWYDASDVTTITESGGAVSQWNDKSGNGNHATQGTSANQPETGLQTLNGLSLLTVRDGDKTMSVTNSPTALMGVAVVNIQSTDTTTLLNIGSTSDSTHEFFIRGVDPQVSFDGSGSTTGKISVDGNPFSGFSAGHSVTSTGAHIWDGVFNSSNSINTILNRVGLASDATGHDVGEILWFSSELSPENRQSLEGYLAHKWGLAGNLPGDHPYKTVPPGGSVVELMLDGSVIDTDGPTGDPLTFLWTKVSGPGNVSFADDTAVDTTVTIDQSGTYVLRLTSDDNGVLTSDEITLTINNGADTDSDGMDDTWEQTNFGDLDETGSGDFDNDGYTNLQEFTNGTDPTVDQAPGAPTNLVASFGDSQVSLDWDDNSDPDLASYTVKRSTTSGSGYTVVQTGLTSSSYVDSTVTNGIEYFYIVTAFDENGSESVPSNEDSATPITGTIFEGNGVSGEANNFISNANNWSLGIPVGNQGTILVDAGFDTGVSHSGYNILHLDGTVSRESGFSGFTLSGGSSYVMNGATTAFSGTRGLKLTDSTFTLHEGNADMTANGSDSVITGSSALLTINGGTFLVGRDLYFKGGDMVVNGGTLSVADDIRTDHLSGGSNSLTFNGGSTTVATNLISDPTNFMQFTFGGSTEGSLTVSGILSGPSTFNFLPGTKIAVTASGSDEWAAAEWAADRLLYDGQSGTALGKSWAQVTAADGLAAGVRFVYDSGTETLSLESPVGPQDLDGDGMDDAWETTHFPGQENEKDGSHDSDSDGIADFFEYLYDSDPNDASSRGFQLKAGPNGSTVLFEWDVKDGFALGSEYQIEYSTDLSNPDSWNPLSSDDYTLTPQSSNGMSHLELEITADHGDNVFIRLVQP